MQRVVGEYPHGEGGCIGAPHDDGAGMLQVGDNRAVFVGDEVLERDHAVVGRQTGLIDIDLGGDRNAMQRRQRVAARAGGVGRLGLGARLVFQHAHHGIDRRIDLVQASQHRVDRLAG